MLKGFRKIHKYELENNFVHEYFLIKPIEMKEKFKRTDTKKRWSGFFWMSALTLVDGEHFPRM